MRQRSARAWQRSAGRRKDELPVVAAGSGVLVEQLGDDDAVPLDHADHLLLAAALVEEDRLDAALQQRSEHGGGRLVGTVDEHVRDEAEVERAARRVARVDARLDVPLREAVRGAAATRLRLGRLWQREQVRLPRRLQVEGDQVEPRRRHASLPCELLQVPSQGEQLVPGPSPERRHAQERPPAAATAAAVAAILTLAAATAAACGLQPRVEDASCGGALEECPALGEALEGLKAQVERLQPRVGVLLVAPRAHSRTLWR
mmetsp:Transcript_25344/g.80328  ORF Transcript_25344/g.80328 Transcript_25344/m.80328 type:complete len:260 (-) Transcript_25344:721-1500(-)